MPTPSTWPTAPTRAASTRPGHGAESRGDATGRTAIPRMRDRTGRNFQRYSIDFISSAQHDASRSVVDASANKERFHDESKDAYVSRPHEKGIFDRGEDWAPGLGTQ